MAQYERKFIVLNIKHLETASEEIPKAIEKFKELLDFIENWVPEHTYYVCNQDEPYAEKVIDVILQGENAKEK